MSNKEPLVLACGDGQEVELCAPVQDGADEVFGLQPKSRFFTYLAHRRDARILSLLDPPTDRKPPVSLGLVLVVSLRQEKTTSVVEEEDAGGLPVGLAVRVQRPVECAHVSRVSWRRRIPQTSRTSPMASTGNSIAP